VAIAPAVECPNGTPVAVSVTFVDPNSSVTDRLSDPCNAIWASNPNDNRATLDSSTENGDPSGATTVDPTGENPSAADFWATDTMFADWDGTEPFLYTVSGPSGLLAQGAYTGTAHGTVKATIIDENHNMDGFINTCIDGGYTIYSMNGGDLYCTVYSGSATTTFTTGWPPPVIPKPYTLTRPYALGYARSAISYFSKSPRQVKLSSCTRLTRTRWRCAASWRDRTYRYAGNVTVWDTSQASKYFYYGLDVRRTKLDCTQRCTRRIRVS
jgi:hypothetical protein